MARILPVFTGPPPPPPPPPPGGAKTPPGSGDNDPFESTVPVRLASFNYRDLAAGRCCPMWVRGCSGTSAGPGSFSPN